MTLRTLAPVVCLLLAALPISAQGVPTVDEQIQRLKGIPGSEKAIQQLEAHRAEIEKAEGAAPKQNMGQDTGPRAPVDIEAVHSFATIPQPPASAGEAFKRYGHFSGSSGGEVACDVQTKDLHARLAAWGQALNEHALRYSSMGSAGALVGNGATMTDLGNASMRLDAELKACEKAFHAEAKSTTDGYTTHLNQIKKSYSAKINACEDANSHAGGGSCDYLYREQDDALVAAGAPFLLNYNQTCADYREKLHRIAAEAQETLDKARKTLGEKIPAFADTSFTRLSTLEMMALGDAVDAVDQATVLVHDQTGSLVWSDDAQRLGLTQ